MVSCTCTKRASIAFSIAEKRASMYSRSSFSISTTCSMRASLASTRLRKAAISARACSISTCRRSICLPRTSDGSGISVLSAAAARSPGLGPNVRASALQTQEAPPSSGDASRLLRCRTVRFERSAYRIELLAFAPSDRRGRLVRIRVVEGGLAVLDFHPDDAAPFQLPEQKFLGQRLLDVLLNDAGERPSAEAMIVTLVGQPLTRLVGELDRDLPVGELRLQLHHELVDDQLHHFR